MHQDLTSYVAEAELADDLAVLHTADNSDTGWLHLIVQCEDTAASEFAAGLADRHGFSLVDVDFDNRTLRFNKEVVPPVVRELESVGGVEEVHMSNSIIVRYYSEIQHGLIRSAIEEVAENFGYVIVNDADGKHTHEYIVSIDVAGED